MSQSEFKVIIVGGGPVGLVAAHALHHAGIDFTVLEQHEGVFEDVGASVVIFPHNLRVLYQLGLKERLDQISVPMVRQFAAKSRYQTGRKLSDIEVTDAGVRVTCADGSAHSGSLVIGADGTYSNVRSIIRRNALESDPKLEASWDAEHPWLATYRCLWASFRRPPGPDPGANYETHAKDRSAVYLTGKDRAWIFLYEKLDKPTRERVTYDEHDAAAFARSFADWPLAEGLKVDDVLADTSFVSGMGNLDEGVASSLGELNPGVADRIGRLVLVGDSWHKFTPNAGLGLNNGIQDVVTLSNKLRSLLFEENPRALPDTETLYAVAHGYYSDRSELLQADYKRAAQATRLAARETTLHHILESYVFSIDWLLGLLVNKTVAPLVKAGRVLSYIDAAEYFSGLIPWDHRLS
ncbi:2-polyprenyl-6-methoxyphenol hydroxylase [Geosmithia morbida]|uniref:2-polyprenyl-6-methoxyphenol hydroxylase n=1 Tax=Geosmithia morbida TaxID=1094350 RepID=A0A9P5D0C1_9HYPO|nr:2-polyprenyl-6-methoxyphenol hydroxylase [Geosmithia morbida]KAF4119296.1 2-polyprenyl-6-methoxyphenol hydroxylase [Geosmithia morbida]